MNILSWAALAVLVYYAFKGWRRGLIMTVFSMFATVIAIALAAQLSPQLSQNWQNTAYFDAVSQRVEASLFKNQDEQEDTDKEHMIDRLPLPDIVQQALANSDDTQKDVLGISAFKAYIANYVTELISISRINICNNTIRILRYCSEGNDNRFESWDIIC